MTIFSPGSRSDVSVPLSYVFAMKQFETHPSWGAIFFRIDKKGLNRRKDSRRLIPFELSVRIHAGVSLRRQQTDADYLLGLDALQRCKTFWDDREQVLNSV